MSYNVDNDNKAKRSTATGSNNQRNNISESSASSASLAELATTAKAKRAAEQIVSKSVQRWWFAIVGLVLGLVSFGFAITMAIRSERLNRARSAADKLLHQRTSEFTRIAGDFVGAIDEQEARIRDNIDRLDQLQHYWIAALDNTQRTAEQTYAGVRQLQLQFGTPNPLPPLSK